MGRNRRIAVFVLASNNYRARMVHQYVVEITCATLTRTVCYALGIYLLNLFLAFLQPKFDPSLEQDTEMEEGPASLPVKQDEEFRPFIRRLPEFKFWLSATRATAISFVCSWFSVFDIPVFWQILVIYWIILFTLTSKSQCNSNLSNNSSETSNPAYDQVSLCAIYRWQKELYQEHLMLSMPVSTVFSDESVSMYRFSRRPYMHTMTRTHTI
jgi:hypothetical protein